MMEIASTNYLADLVDVMEDYPASSFDEYPVMVEDWFNKSLSSSGSPDECYSSNPYFNDQTPHRHFVAPPTKKLKTFETMPPPPPPSSQHIISFDNHSSQVASMKLGNPTSVHQLVKKKKKKKKKKNIDFAAAVHDDEDEDTVLFNYDDSRRKYYKAATTARNPVQAQEHVIAERKRREKLSQSFVALSAMLPGLNKMDKASILGDAIKYVKQLQERLETLEEQARNKRRVESAVVVKRCFIFDDENNKQYEESSSPSSSSSSLPEMQARVCGKEVLMRIQCKKENGREVVAAILAQLENHHLTPQTTTSLPFGNNTLDITILAQMNEEYVMTAKELLGTLRLALTHTPTCS